MPVGWGVSAFRLLKKTTLYAQILRISSASEYVRIMSTNAVPLVSTKSGTVRGKQRTSIDGHSYVSFQGIPFAKPPLGRLRFKKPQPVDAWTEPLDAFTHPHSAATSTPDNTRMDPQSSEDCLYLNIFTRNLHPQTPRPVMIFIHGGGFMRGSTSDAKRGPDFLLRHDVIMVTVAYRLGALGFLSVADPKFGCPGNAGLRDQAMGVQWIVDNVRAFGGDPNNITLFGESAGAVSVHLHMLSDYSKGLFQKAIVQSGTSFCPWAEQPHKDLNGMLARKLGWNGEGGVDAMMEVLQHADAADIVVHQWLGDRQDTQSGIYFVFVPCVEPYQDADSFLPNQTSEMARTAWGNTIPLIIGWNSDEGFLCYGHWKHDKRMFDDDGHFVHSIPREILPFLDAEQRQQRVEAMKRFYYGESVPSVDNLLDFVQLSGDRMFVYPTIAAVRVRQQAVDSAATFVYRFCFDSGDAMFGDVKMGQCGEIVKGTIHAEDLMYLLRQAHIDYAALPKDSPEWKVIENFAKLWTQFAETGHPSDDWEDLSGHLELAPIRCLNISSTTAMIDLPETERIAFWDSMHK